jgi:hypothetical protein
MTDSISSVKTSQHISIVPKNANSDISHELFSLGSDLIWPLLILFIALFFKEHIIKIFNKISEFKIGNFSVVVENNGARLGVKSIDEDLKGLSYEELGIFLIVGGERSEYYEFSDKRISPDHLKRIYENYKNRNLIEFEEVTSTGKPELKFQTTEKGRKVHTAILDSIYSELINKSPPTKKKLIK